MFTCMCLQKNSIEALSKDELISKYKGLLGIAKKAKLAKDGKITWVKSHVKMTTYILHLSHTQSSPKKIDS